MVTGGVMLVRKVSEILGVLANGEANATELAEAIDEPRSSVYRILATMKSEGLVEAGRESGKVRLGLRFLALASAVMSGFDERTVARPVMEQLHELTGETVFLCVPRGDLAVCIERIDGKRVRSLALQLGGSLPLHAGAASRALLAGRPPAEWGAYLEANAPLTQFTPSTPTSEEQVLDLLKQTVADGFAISDQDVTVGVAAIGAPIVDYTGRTCAALSISGVRESIMGADYEAWRDAVVAGAAEVSRNLGAEHRMSS